MTNEGLRDTTAYEAGVADALRDAWAAGGPVDLAAFLAARPALTPHAVADAAAVDLAERWQRSDRATAESYFLRFPAVAAVPEAALMLVYAETLARGRTDGTTPPLAEYQARFPALAGDLDKLWEVHAALARPSPDAAGPAAGPGGADPGRYDVFEEIGRGALGVVYRARHRKLDRPVALKKLRAAALMHPREFVRFLEEARLTAKLDHPNIVKVFDVGQHEGSPYIALELVTGGTLAAKLGGQVMPPKEAAGLVATLADAVAFAHAAGIIHRDLKPANILLDAAGRPKVSDFGLAKHGQLGAAATRTGDILGTPAYMAPEQAKGQRAVGPAADVYGLGAILYETLTGRPPLLGPTTPETLMLVVGQIPVSPRAVNALVPRDLAAVCMRCLEKDPARRFPAAADLADELRRFLAGTRTRTRPLRPAGRAGQWARLNPLPAALVGAVAAALLVGAGASTYFAAKAADRAAAAEAAERAAADRAADAVTALRAAEAARGETQLALTRAEWLVYAGQMQRAKGEWDARDLHRMIGVLGRTRWDFRGPEYAFVLNASQYNRGRYYGPPGVARGVAFDPEGVVIFAGGTAGVTAWDAATRDLLFTLDAGTDVNGVAVDPAGNTIAAAGADGTLVTWDVKTRKRAVPVAAHAGGVAVAPGPGPGAFVTAGADGAAKLWAGGMCKETFRGAGPLLAVAAGETRLAAGGADGSVHVWDFAKPGGPARVFPRPPGSTGPARAVAITPDGTTVAAAVGAKVYVRAVAGDAPARVFAGHAGDVTGVAFRPAGRGLATVGLDDTARVWDFETGQNRVIRRGDFDGIRGLALSADGRVGFGGGKADVLAVDPDPDAGCVRIKIVGYDQGGPGFGPGGKRIAAGTTGNRVGVWDADTGELVDTYPGHADAVTGCAFSPDGKLLASCGKDGRLVVRPAAGGPAVVIPVRSGIEGGWAFAAAFHPTEPEVVAAADDGRVRTYHPATGKLIRNYVGHTGAAVAAAYSPDGTTIATAGYMDKTVRVWNRSTGQSVHTLATRKAAIRVAFSADGRRLFASTWGDAVEVWDAKTGRPLPPVAAHSKSVTGLAATPDGTRVLTASIDGLLKFWHADTLTELLAVGTPGGPKAEHLVVSPDGGRVAVASDDGYLRVWRIADVDPVRSIHPAGGAVHGAAVRPDGKQVVGALADGSVVVYDSATGARRHTLVGHRGAARAAEYTPDSKRLATAGDDGTVRLWDPETGNPLDQLDGPTGPVRRLAVHPTGGRIAAVGADGRVTVWDPAAGTHAAAGTGCTDFAWSGDGRRAARGGPAGAAVTDAAGNDPKPLQDAGGPVDFVRWGPDDKTVFGLTAAGRVVAWDADTRAVKTSWAAHPGGGGGLAVGPGGTRIATCGADMRVKVWPAAGPPAAESYSAFSGAVLALAWGRDGNLILAGSADTTLKIVRMK